MEANETNINLDDKKMIPSKTLFIRDVIQLLIIAVSCTVTYAKLSHKADVAHEIGIDNKITLRTINERLNKSNEEQAQKLTDLKEYARDYAYRKTTEVDKEVKKNAHAIYVIREEHVKTQVKLSHIEKNQEEFKKSQDKMLELLNKIYQK